MERSEIFLENDKNSFRIKKSGPGSGGQRKDGNHFVQFRSGVRSCKIPPGVRAVLLIARGSEMGGANYLGGTPLFLGPGASLGAVIAVSLRRVLALFHPFRQGAK